MKLILTQTEIEAAIKAYISNMVSVREGTSMDIEFTATRGESGLTASVDINYLGVTTLDISTPAKPTTTEKVTRDRAPAAAAAPAEPEPAAAEEVAASDAAPPADKGASLF